MLVFVTYFVQIIVVKICFTQYITKKIPKSKILDYCCKEIVGESNLVHMILIQTVVTIH